MKQNKKIFITAGHRGGSTGANSGKYHEAELAIKLRDDISKILFNKGFNVYNDKNNAELSVVVNDINKHCSNLDLCLDIHFNASNSPSANGTEVLIPNSPSNTEMELAEDILYGVCSVLGTRNRGVKKEGQSQYKRLAMLSGVKCNSVLLEVCFLTSNTDMQSYETKYLLLVNKIENVLEKYLNL